MERSVIAMNAPRSAAGDGTRWWRVGWSVVTVLVLLMLYAASLFVSSTRDDWLSWAGFMVSVWCFMALWARAASWWRGIRRRRAPAPGLLPKLRGGDWVVRLDSPGERQDSVVKVVCAVTGLRVSEARRLADRAPVVVADGLSAEGAKRTAALLGAAGATTSVDQIRSR
jgi:hypothetical protein